MVSQARRTIMKDKSLKFNLGTVRAYAVRAGSYISFLNQYFQPRTYGDLVVCEGNINGYRKRVCLDPPGEEVHEREDGWMEVEMGEFFSEDHEDNLVGFKLWDMNSQLTRFLVVEGVEFRPQNM